MKTNKTNHANITNMTLAAMFIAIGMILPMITGHIQVIGNMLLPMHIPVILCGLICGPIYGLIVGFITPLLRSAMFGMPPLMPTGICMAFELATYGVVVGYLYKVSKWKCIFSLYRSMILAMIAGRIVWGLARMLMAGIGSSEFGVMAWVTGAWLTAWPGIIIQLVIIPTIMVALNKTGLVRFTQKESIALQK